MASPEIQNLLPNEENVARLCNSQMVYDNILSPNAFNLRNLRKPEDYISVWRLAKITPTREKVHAVIKRWELEDCVGYGIAQVETIHKCKRDPFYVLAKEDINSDYHAGLYLYRIPQDQIKGRQEDPMVLGFMTMLSKLFKFVAFPPLTEE